VPGGTASFDRETRVIGNTLADRYRIDSEIGRGAMGVVYRAHDATLDRDVAVKVMSAHAPDEDTLTRWRHEAQAAARLQHPNIVAVFDAGVSNGTPFIVMEMIDGQPVDPGREWDLREVVDLGRQLCAALGHAHANGIVHRDLKPENVLVKRAAATATIKLTDLGVARLSHSTRLTQEGTLIGTAAYFAPEQALGIPADGRADLYALGVLLYQLVAGRLPFESDDPLAVISQHLHAPVVPPSVYCKDLPTDLERIIVRCLAKDREQRWPDAAALEAALASVQLDVTHAPAAPLEPSEGRLDGLARGRMIGRTAELTQLRDLWMQAVRGRSHMALVSGEPGVGKTRLAREVMVLAGLQGATVLQGGCYEFEATTPYLPWVEGLRQWVKEQPAEVLSAVLGDTAPELARLAPEIVSKLGSQPAPAAVGEQQERMRLFDALARFLQSLSARRGLLVFLDDLHWADHGTLQLLHYVLRHLRDDRLLVLGCYREVELDRAHPLSAALVEWNRERIATRIPLTRLPLGDTERMLATMFSQERVSSDFAAAIHRETEGNPFFVEEVVKSLIENGQIYRENNRWQRRDVEELTIPQSIKAAIGRRLSRLSEACTTVLHTAAALGKVFEFGTLAAVSDAGEDALLDALDEATEAQLVRAESGERFAFTHDKIREVLHEELNPIRQRRLHQKIAETLERLYAHEMDDYVQELAYHYAQSSNLEKGYDFSLAAAAQARRVFAHEEVLDHLERARDCAEALEDTTRLMKVERRLADVHDARGETTLAAEHGERALALATEPRERAAIRSQLGGIYVTTADPRGREHLERALVELDPASQKLELANATMALGRYEHLRGHHHAAMEVLERARGMFGTDEDPDMMMMILSYLSGAYQHDAQYEKSIEFARQAIEIGERYERPAGVAGGWEFVAEDNFLLGRFAEASHAAELDRSIGQRVGAMARVAWANFASTNIHRMSGDLDAAVRSGRDCVDLARQLGEERLEILGSAALARALTDRGDLDEALELARATFERAQRTRQTYPLVDTAVSLGAARIRRGDLAEGVAFIRGAEKHFEGTDSRGVLMGWLANASILFAEAGENALARQVVEKARAIHVEDLSPMFGWLVRIGEARAASAEPGAAPALWDPVIAGCESLGMRLWQGRALAARGALRAAAGDEAGARVDRGRAAELLEACGARLDLDGVRAALGMAQRD